MKQSTLITAFLLLCFLLVGCSYNPFITNNHTTGNPAGAVVGAAAGAGGVALLGGPKSVMALAGIGGGMLGYYVTTLRYDAGGIIQAGGQVYKLGDFVGIDIPSDQLFQPNTAELMPNANVILDSAITVLKRYPNNNILISGNTSGFAPTKWELRLSEKRAQRVAAYLWRGGINAFRERSTDLRKLTYVGYGNYFPISNVYTNDGIRQNSRIQITSYPSKRDLLLDEKHQVMNNYAPLQNGDDNLGQPCSSCTKQIDFDSENVGAG